jgi:hypothetical protein
MYPGVLRPTTPTIDAACMWMVKNPEWFDVAVTTNLFGDIITDLARWSKAAWASRLWQHPPGKVSMFEPIHGSGPECTAARTRRTRSRRSCRVDAARASRRGAGVAHGRQRGRGADPGRPHPQLAGRSARTDELGSMVAAEVEAVRPVAGR